MLKQTPLHALHVKAGARMVDFAGWSMPLSYGSQLEEHHAVRTTVGMFDVSHMQIIDVQGPACLAFLQRLLANDVARAKEAGQALYSCMLNAQGGVIDDLLVYFFAADAWRLVVNAARAADDLEWMQTVAREAPFEVALKLRADLAIMAIQGPAAAQTLWRLRPEWQALAGQLKRFFAVAVDENVVLARTGYTGEDGYEIMTSAQSALSLWQDLQQAGVQPCGLAARDTLRLEAGLSLYGQDMDQSTQPAQAGLAWTVNMQNPERNFIGRKALEDAPQPAVAFVGLQLLDRGVIRPGAAIRTGAGNGQVTSGTMSPTLGYSIAMARVPPSVKLGDALEVQVRGKWMAAKVVKMPFIHNQK